MKKLTSICLAAVLVFSIVVAPLAPIGGTTPPVVTPQSDMPWV